MDTNVYKMAKITAIAIGQLRAYHYKYFATRRISYLVIPIAYCGNNVTCLLLSIQRKSIDIDDISTEDVFTDCLVLI